MSVRPPSFVPCRPHRSACMRHFARFKAPLPRSSHTHIHTLGVSSANSQAAYHLKRPTKPLEENTIPMRTSNKRINQTPASRFGSLRSMA